MAWIAAGKIAVPQRERDFAVILCSYGEQLSLAGITYIIEQVCMAGDAGMGPQKRRELRTELQVHAHAYKLGPVELTEDCMTAVAVDS